MRDILILIGGERNTFVREVRHMGRTSFKKKWGGACGSADPRGKGKYLIRAEGGSPGVF